MKFYSKLLFIIIALNFGAAFGNEKEFDFTGSVETVFKRIESLENWDQSLTVAAQFINKLEGTDPKNRDLILGYEAFAIVRVAISSGKFTQSSVDVGPKDKRYSPFARAIYDSLYSFESSFTSQELFSKILTYFPKNLEQEPTWGVIAAASHQSGDFEFLTVR